MLEIFHRKEFLSAKDIFEEESIPEEESRRLNCEPFEGEEKEEELWSKKKPFED